MYLLFIPYRLTSSTPRCSMRLPERTQNTGSAFSWSRREERRFPLLPARRRNYSQFQERKMGRSSEQVLLPRETSSVWEVAGELSLISTTVYFNLRPLSAPNFALFSAQIRPCLKRWNGLSDHLILIHRSCLFSPLMKRLFTCSEKNE